MTRFFNSEDCKLLLYEAKWMDLLTKIVGSPGGSALGTMLIPAQKLHQGVHGSDGN